MLGYGSVRGSKFGLSRERVPSGVRSERRPYHAEGNYLEPDIEHGRAHSSALQEVLAEHSVCVHTLMDGNAYAHYSVEIQVISPGANTRPSNPPYGSVRLYRLRHGSCVPRVGKRPSSHNRRLSRIRRLTVSDTDSLGHP